ncbi:terminase small subunit [uncultured Mediterranean phage uvMED]|nr:terminase small subunit [uncultured Mediterranean phage uvMED]
MFCKEYLIDLNATQACIRAGYSQKTAEVQGPRLLGNVRVKSEIDRLKAIREKKVELTAEKVLEDIERVRKKAEGSEQYTVSLKASELQGKHLAMFTEKHKVDGEIKMPVVQIELADV